MALEFNSSNFDAEVLNYKGAVVVDFWATWCGPCRMMGPVIEKMAEKLAGKVKVGKVDVDKNEDLAMKYKVSSIPTIAFIKDGVLVGTSVGYKSEEEIEKLIYSKLL